ncbi:MAG: methylhydantoinase [Pseudonocardiales bacterium]|nr:methylhydantoinase [Pseudonocardiales bacterium]
MTNAGGISGRRLAVDIGGTFVDAVEFDEASGELRVHKAATTPDAPARGVVDAVAALRADLSDVTTFAHGTTLGLNAILQRRGAEVGLVTNAGFRDLFEIARAAIPTEHMYNFSYAPPAPLVPRRRRVGVTGRLDAAGREVVALADASVLEAGAILIEQQGLTSIAVCFLHTYANPSHERRAAELLRTAYPHVAVSISSDITREYREYERTSTVTLDAYIRPALRDYLVALEAALGDIGLRTPMHIMRSGGGAMTAEQARRAPLMTVLSGPAGGVIGASAVAVERGWPRVLSFDVGGTSVDACVIEDGTPSDVHEASIDGFPLLIPIFDIRTVGAGGGSIAWTDDGLLRVGPRSAGAVPGPVAYGTGGVEPTLTDAALTLGYLDAKTFLAGGMAIDAEAAREAIRTRIAQPLGIDEKQAADSVFRVLLARTVGALREITVERGLDPREFTLLAFGGAGPLLGPMLAREMGIATCAIPPVPAAFSAYGMLLSDLQHEASATILAPLDDAALIELRPVVAELAAVADGALSAQDVPVEHRETHVIVDVRYRGQEHSLPLELNDQDTAEGLLARFHESHRARHGHAMPESGQLVTLRVRGIGRLPKPISVRLTAGDGGAPRPIGGRTAYDIASGIECEFLVFERASLGAGACIDGPAIIEEGTSTTVIFGDQQLTVDDFGDMLVTTSAGAAR